MVKNPRMIVGTIALLVLVIVGLVAVIASLFPLEMSEPIPTPHLPDSYFVNSVGYNEKYDGQEKIKISCLFSRGSWKDKVILPELGVGEFWLGIESSYFILDGGKAMSMDKNGNVSTLTLWSKRGEGFALTAWTISLSEESEEWEAEWSGRFSLGEEAILPTGEKLIFIGFSSNESQLNSYTPMFKW